MMLLQANIVIAKVFHVYAEPQHSKAMHVHPNDVCALTPEIH